MPPSRGGRDESAEVVRFYAEVGTDGGALLFTFDPPGLAARGYTLQEALERARGGYAELVEMQEVAAGGGPATAGVQREFVIAEQVNRRGGVSNGRTSATFGPDLVPVSPGDLPGIISLLGESRRRLLALRPGLEAAAVGGREIMEYRSAPHRMAIRRQLEHIASAEKWYLSHVWSFLPRLRPARDVWERLAAVRTQVIETLDTATGDGLLASKSVSGETWTVRKVVRRLMYHEVFHRDAIRRNMKMAGLAQGA